ncbi:MAG: multiple sugar transport system substrate-binding protein [Frankiales bacterium]|jgi:ABC-type glycerol-3-phosphate transport system substrate-binding protein|nr:multiple sugar transport system substrate-binding protein [Frankiales bacterium]
MPRPDNHLHGPAPFIASLAVGTLLLVGCGSSSSSSASPTGAATTGSGASVPTSAAAVLPSAAAGSSSPAAATNPIGSFSGQKLVLSRWAGDPWTAGQKTAAAEWGKDTSGSISIDAIPYENLHDKQALTLAGAGGYDIIYVHPSWFGEFAKAGYLAPIDSDLSDASKNPPGFSAASYLPSVLSQGAYNGKQYCLPDFVSTVVLAYRTDLFTAAGLQPPKTLDDVVADAAKLNGKNGASGIILPGKATGAVSDVMGSLITAQGNWWYGPTGKTTLDVAAATKAVTFYTSAAKYAPTGLLNDSVDEVSLAAAQGKAAMAISTTPSLQALEDPSKSSTVGKWGYVPLAFTADKPAGELIYWNWCISAKSSHKDAAYSFLQWYTSGAQQAKVAIAAATAGATKDFYTNTTVLAKLPFLTAMNQALTHANPQPSLPTWPKIQNDIETAVQNAILGKITPAAAAAKMKTSLSSNLGG